MFFSTYVLTKKGPLAKVWLAAHWDRRLTRNEVKVVDLSQTIVHIVHPVVPIALRTSGELLVGVVRIYALKVRHLLRDATEATLFLKVTTATGKGNGHRASITSTIDGVEKTTTLEGVLVGAKGDVEAVTFDLTDAKRANMPDNAEARFDAIADLLHGRASGGGQDGPLPSAWYAVDPSSQAADEMRNTQQDYDEIAKMRADLLAFGERTSSSNSKSKSSLSSIEKARGSMAAGDVPFPPVGDELDIGVPLPEELPTDLPVGNMDMAMPADPFDFPEVMAGDAQQPPARAAKRARPVNVLDLAATTLPRQTFEKSLADRSDILHSEPRRGPLNEGEERDRYTIAGSANPTDAVAAVSAAAASAGAATAELLSIVDAAPLSHLPGAALRVVYASALQQSVAAAVEEAIRVSQDSTHRAAELPMGGMPEDDFMAAPPTTAQQHQQQQQQEDEGPKGLSISAVKTLERIRDEVVRVSGTKRSRSSTSSVFDLVDTPCFFRDVTGGMRRREAARAFVDVLALASKHIVSARQDVSTREVEIAMREEAAAVLATQ